MYLCDSACSFELYTSWDSWCHLVWIIPLAGQKQVRNLKHGRPPIPAAQIATEVSESYWILLLLKLGEWHMSPSFLSMKYRQDVCISNIWLIRYAEWMKPFDIWYVQDLQQYKNVVKKHLAFCAFISIIYLKLRALMHGLKDSSQFIPCIILLNHFMLGNSWQAESAAVEQRENADLMLDWTGLLSADHDCRCTCTGYCGAIRKQIIEEYLLISR